MTVIVSATYGYFFCFFFPAVLICDNIPFKGLDEYNKISGESQVFDRNGIKHCK